jgi:hypothetical protein
MPKETFENRGLIVLFQKDHFFEESLSEKVRDLINKIPDRNLTLSEIVILLGDDGLLLFAALLSLIFLIPVSIPGFSTVFGVIIFFIGWSHLFDRSLWIPGKMKTKTLSAEKLRTTLKKGLKFIHWLEKVSRPHRFNVMINNIIAKKLNGFLVLVGAVLLVIPFGILPFSNTLPALIILFLSIGIIQKDGLIILLGYFFVLGSFIYFLLFFSTIVLAFKKIVETVLW